MRIVVQSAPFDFGAEAQSFASGHKDMGAIVTFTGVVRDLEGDTLDRMVIEHYPGMTEKALEKIATEAMTRWGLGDALVIHRFGELRPGDMIMMVATAAPHRVDAFDAAEYLMDYLKSRAPFWKQEFTSDGGAWVSAKYEDEDALKRW
ncbi:molybdenum cofactor biosynthesis protein MoaE [Shimia thalassica]|uniref:molybdenum cofactor biosynthesis protein MoaE n=1 Tax=Shimia thalassica TaxID=1715693 RepID=UPI0026E14530|nr:molybdenum cofactor biosynthesis protein MoaE [Shimia thalassica]MDO6478589.1 molybdenum cofactor biosynthesis protein MoaE [Shimia thalassica]